MNVDEVLAKMDALDANEEEIQYIIDENLRVISIPPLGVVLGVEGDKDVNSAKFKMVRYYKGIDLSKFEIRINFANANGDLSYYTIKNPTVTDDSLTFDWLVGYLATKYKGTVRFIVRMITTDASTGEVQQAFDTTIGEAQSLEGLLVDVPTDEKVYDIVAQLKADLTDHVNDLLKTIPEDYNELTKKVEDNTLGISGLKEDIVEISLASVMIKPFNLLDFASIENNKNLQSYTGLVIDGNSKVTNFIPLKYNETLAIYDASYNRTSIDSICEYGKNGKYLNGATLLGAIEYTPKSKDCAYIKLQNSYMDSSFQVITGGYIPEQNYPYFTPYYQNVPQNCVVPEQFGGIGNGEFDCAKSLQRSVEYAQDNKKTLMLLPNKTYYISRQVNLTKPVNINGNNATIKCGGGYWSSHK